MQGGLSAASLMTQFHAMSAARDQPDASPFSIRSGSSMRLFGERSASTSAGVAPSSYIAAADVAPAAALSPNSRVFSPAGMASPGIRLLDPDDMLPGMEVDTRPRSGPQPRSASRGRGQSMLVWPMATTTVASPLRAAQRAAAHPADHDEDSFRRDVVEQQRPMHPAGAPGQGLPLQQQPLHRIPSHAHRLPRHQGEVADFYGIAVPVPRGLPDEPPPHGGHLPHPGGLHGPAMAVALPAILRPSPPVPPQLVDELQRVVALVAHGRGGSFDIPWPPPADVLLCYAAVVRSGSYVIK